MKDLVFNITILISFISVFNQMAKNLNLSLNSCRKRGIILGIAIGVLSCILMVFKVEIMPGFFIDYRNAPTVFVAALGGGPIACCIAAMIHGFFGFLILGESDVAFCEMVITILAGIISMILVKKDVLTSLKHVIIAVIIIVLECVRITITSDYISFMPKVFVNVILGNTLLILIGWYFIDSLLKSNNLFRKYWNESTTDFLTGLNNVRQFDRIYNSLASQLSSDRKFALLIIDIDHFKKVNDSHGHYNGDLVLNGLGNLLLKYCREIDVVSRNGGEEFSIILFDCGPNEAADIAEKLRNTIEQHEFAISEGLRIKITVSIGIATYPNTTNDFSILIKAADVALYKAKQSGRNRSVLFENELTL
ncbi:diguanylate cyclase [Proteus mirabilis]|uniref:diguanylate cyclase n=1 Tax=Proteus mirabilis TaxID=584 RepID=UPI0031972ED2